MNKHAEIKKMRDSDLKQLVHDLREQTSNLNKLQREVRSGKLKSHQKIREARKNIARIYTIMSEKALSAAMSQSQEQK